MSRWEVVRVLLHDFREQIGELLIVLYDLFVFSFLLINISRVDRANILILSLGICPIRGGSVAPLNERIGKLVE